MDDEAVAILCAAARRACPGVAVDTPAFAAFTRAHPHGPAAAALGDEAAGELLLAFAAGRGDARALALFEERYLPAARAALAPMKLGAAAVDDVLSRVREKLLLPDADGRVRLADYAGQGKLRALVQVVASRAALDELRKQRPGDAVAAAEAAAVDDLAVAGEDPALARLYERYRADFRVCFAEAVAALAARERNLLRLHLVGGVTLDKLAEMYQVNRATVVRWLAKAREAVAEATRAGLQARLGVAADELDSLMRAVQSRLDVSLSRVFATPA